MVEAPNTDSRIPLTRAEMAALLALVVLLLAGVAGLMIRDHYGGPRLEEVMSAGQLPPYRVNINAASAAELALLPGIGPVRAERIVRYREEHGDFASVDDLARVPGLGAKTVANLAPYATVDEVH